MQLHPAAMGKTKRSIFERQIVWNGGTLVDSPEKEVPAGKFLVLVESSSMDSDKLQAIVEKCIERFPDQQSEVVSTAWLSKCLEEKRKLETDFFRLDKKLLAKRTKADVSSEPSTSCCPGVEEANDVDRVKHKFVCAQPSENAQSANLNKNITDELEKLASAYKSANDRWRAFGYQKAIAAIKSHPRQISSRMEASTIPNVGAKMAEKVRCAICDTRISSQYSLCRLQVVKVDKTVSTDCRNSGGRLVEEGVGGL